MTALVDLLVDGQSIGDYATIVEDFSGLHASAPLRGSNHVLPLRPGALWVPKVAAAYGFSVGVAVLPVDPDDGTDPTGWDATVAQWATNWRALLALLDSTVAPLTLTRVVATTAGTAYEQCSAEVVGSIAPTMVGPTASRAVIDFLNLDGGWEPLGTPS